MKRKLMPEESTMIALLMPFGALLALFLFSMFVACVDDEGDPKDKK